MPNVALMIGAGLIGALVAGLYLLYTDEGFHNNYEQPHYPPRYQPPRYPPPPRNNGRRSDGTNSPEGYDLAIANGRRRRRRDEEDENCVICCDEMQSATPFTLETCGHRFHKKCLQQWVETVVEGVLMITCPKCRLTISTHERSLLSAKT